MARASWALLCERVLVDPQSDGVTLVELTDEIEVAGDPGAPPVTLPVNLNVVTYWVRGSATRSDGGETRYLVKSPTGAVLDTSVETRLKMDGSSSVFTVVGMESLAISGAGEHSVEIQFRATADEEWKTATAIPVFVHTAVDSAPAAS